MTVPHDPAAGLAELSALVRNCAASGVERRVLLLRTDLLPPRLTLRHHLRLAEEALEPLTTADRARRYDLPEGRIGISWRGDAIDRVNRALASIEHLLLDSPLDAPRMPDLARLFDLPRDGAALLATATLPPPPPRGTAPDPEEDPGEPPILPPLDLDRVDGMELRLASANIARFVRRRSVCRMETVFAPAWENRFLSVRELAAELCPDRDATAEPWLFRRLTRMFDRRMLALLAMPAELRDAGPFGLDLNVGGILSTGFLRFDSALPARLRGHAVLNLQPADIMGDLASFRFAANFARARGYRILLRGVTPGLLAVLNVAALEADYVELRWDSGVEAMDPSALRAGTARWVLSRADTEDAVRWGRAMGIGLFQGDAVHPGAGLPRMRPAA